MAATVVTSTVAVFLPRDFSVGNFVDDAHYVVLAKSIRERSEYRTLNVPGEPPETKYPPGFPVLLATFWSSSNTDMENLDRARWVNLTLVGPAAGALTVLGITGMTLNPWVAAGLAVGGVLAPNTVALWTVPLSGMLFLLLVTIGLLLSHKLPPGWRILVLALAVYVRTIAIVFAAFAIAEKWYRKDQFWLRDAIVLVLAVAPWGIWQVLNRNVVAPELLGLYGSYGAWYVQSLVADPGAVLLRVPVANAWDILIEFGKSLVGAGWLPNVIAAAVGVIACWRIAVLRKIDATTVGGLALYALVMIVWPFPPGRFVADIWPIALLAVGASFHRRAWIVAVVGLVVGGVFLIRGEAIAAHRVRSQIATEVADFADTVVQPNDVLASTNAALYFLRYGVPSVPGQRMLSYRRYRLGYWSTAWGLGDDLWNIVQRFGVTIDVVEARGVEGRYAVGSLVGQCPRAATKLWESENGSMVFRINPEVECQLRRSFP